MMLTQVNSRREQLVSASPVGTVHKNVQNSLPQYVKDEDELSSYDEL